MRSQPGIKTNLVAFYSIARENVLRLFRTWIQSLLPPVVTVTLYFFVFGKFIGKHMPDIHGYTYMQFIVAGLIMMSVIMLTFVSNAFGYFITKLHRSNQDYAVAPISNAVIMWGYVAAGLVRGIIIAVIVGAISLCFTRFMPQHFVVIFASVILASLLFSMFGFTNGLLADSFEDASIVPNFVLTPLVYLGGVFYSIDQLPPFWQHVSMANPIFYIMETFRYGFLGFSDLSVGFSFGMLIVFNVALYMLNIYLMNKGKGIRTQ